LRVIDRSTPKDQQIHVIANNLLSSQASEREELAPTSPAISYALYPASTSWLDMVERFFRNTTQRRIRRAAFRRVPELVTAIDEYIQNHDKTPQPFWTAKPSDILSLRSGSPSSLAS